MMIAVGFKVINTENADLCWQLKFDWHPVIHERVALDRKKLGDH